MAQLPPDGQFLIQQVGDRVILFERYTERELASFGLLTEDGRVDAEGIARAQEQIASLAELTAEQRAFVHFWSGYFYAQAAFTARIE